MDTGVLESFAGAARVQLLGEVAGRLDVVLAAGSVARRESPQVVARVEAAVAAAQALLPTLPQRLNRQLLPLKMALHRLCEHHPGR